jgi:hypothetical protein
MDRDPGGGLAIDPRPCCPQATASARQPPETLAAALPSGLVIVADAPGYPAGGEAAVRVDRPRARREGEPLSPLALVNEGGEVFAWCCGHRRACLSLASGVLW